MTCEPGAGQAQLATDLLAELKGPDAPLLMSDIAGVIGALRAVEVTLFRWLGHRAGSGSSPEEVVWASAASLRAAWRAGELERLLPVSVGLVPPADVAPLSAAGEAALAALLPGAALGSTTDETEHGLLGLPEAATACYDALAAAYAYRLERLSQAADGPLERALCRVSADLQAEHATARRLRKQPGRDA